jgi:hypothetical protein
MKFYYIILLSFVIYTYFFVNLGNTVYRIDSSGKKIFNITSLFTVGFFGPVKTLFILISYPHILLEYISFEFFRLSNPLSAFIFTYYIYKIIYANGSNLLFNPNGSRPNSESS